MGHLNIPLVKKSNPAESYWLSLPRSGRFGKLARAHRKEEASPQKVSRVVGLDVPDLRRGEMQEIFEELGGDGFLPPGVGIMVCHGCEKVFEVWLEACCSSLW